MIKKIVLSSLVCMLTILFFESCDGKKDYSCKCIYKNGADTATTEYVFKDENGGNKLVHEKTCKASEIEARGGEQGKWSCEIKEVKK